MCQVLHYNSYRCCSRSARGVPMALTPCQVLRSGMATVRVHAHAVGTTSATVAMPRSYGAGVTRKAPLSRGVASRRLQRWIPPEVTAPTHLPLASGMHHYW